MKQETGKKQNKWLLPVIIAAVLVIIGIVVAVFMLGGNTGNQGEQPTDAVASGEIYWNIDRANHIDPETGLSVRTAGEDGLYHISFAYNGSVVELTANDKKLVNRIDMMDHMALEVDASGNITNVFATSEVATVAAENFFVQKMEGGVLMLNSSQALNGMEVPYTITDATGIYNVSALAEKPGAVDEVEPMDKVVVIQTKDGSATTHVFIVERMQTSDLYWRVEQWYNSTKKITTRTPDAAGVYTIRFAVNGQQVDLKCKDVEVVSYIDSLSNNVQCTGLTFDEQGFITGTITPANAIRGALVSNQFDVTELTETGFSTTRMLPSSNQGSTWSGNYAEGCKFYDVTGVSGFIGIEVDSLKMNDRVYVLTDAMGDAKIVFITNRMVEGDLYWMVGSRMYNSTTRKTTQKPDESGWYTFKFIKNGKIVELKTKDEAIATAVHAQSPQLMGLDVDGNVITKVYHYVNITGGWAATSGAAVSSINGPIVTTMSSGNTTSLVLNGECTVTNAFEYVEKGFGSYTELGIGDQIYAIRNAGGEIIAIYVTGRPISGGKVYWNVSRKWSNNATTRKPLTSGEYKDYYEFLLTVDGKKPEKFYTKSETIANNIDRQYPASVGLQVKGNIITMAVPSACVVGGSTMANYCHAEYWINEGYEFYALYRATGNGTKVKYNRDTIIYNVSAGAKSHIGEKASDVTLNDQVHVITDTSGVAKYLYIVGQEVAGDPYYNLGQTVDENGNYTFKMVHNGKVVNLKAKDADVAADVRSYSIGMGLHVKNGVITRAFSIASLSNYGGATAANFDVVKISGNKLTMQRTRPSASNQGAEQIVDISGIKLYDVSTGTTTPGKVVKPKVGDRIVFYLNNDGTAPAIGFVTIRCNREGGAFGKCDHCGKTVYWNPWEGQFPANANLEKDNDSTHYYMNYDIKLAQQAFVGNEAQTMMHAVLDLNGKTLSSAKRALGAWYGATLWVMDSSKAQTGTVIGKGDPSNKDSGGVAFVTRGGSIVVNGGTWKVAEDHYTIVDGGIFNGFVHKDFKAGTITINGGKFYGTDVTGNGGTVSSNAPAIVINGGEFFGGKAGNLAGTIACPSNKLTINGGIIHGGEAKYGGTIGCPNLEINGGTIEAGKASVGGDCMYVSSTYKLNITGGKIAQITTTSTWTGSATISGKPEIGELTVASGKYVDLTGVTGGSITVVASGAFTTEFTSDAAAQKVAAFVKPGNEFSEIYVADKRIGSKIERCIFGHTAAEHEELTAAGTPCTEDTLLSWKLWTSTSSLPTSTGNYILLNDVTTVNQTSINGKDVVIDLNGCDITYKIPAPRTANFRVFYLNDSAVSSGATEGATPSTLIITDNSSDDPAEQGTVTAINPEYATNPADEKNWIATAQAKYDALYTIEGLKAQAATTADNKVAAEAKTQAENAAKTKAAALAKEAALKKGAEGSDAYKTEYNAVYDKEYQKAYETEYKAKLESVKAEKYQTWYDEAYNSQLATTEANIAAINAQAEQEITAGGAYEAGSDAFKAAVEAKAAELTKTTIETKVKEQVDGIIASNKATHDAADSGMIAQVGHGNLIILGGNFDASGLNIKKAGAAFYVNKKGTTHAEDSQNLVIMGGVITGGTTNKSGGAIYVGAGANLNMTDGVVNGGTITEGGNHGAAIYATGASTVNVTGGIINGGLAENSASNSGSIYMDGTGGKVNIGGTAVVNAGKAGYGDSMYIRFGTWTICDNAVINGGLHSSSRSKANLYIRGNPTIQRLEGCKSSYSFKINSHAENNLPELDEMGTETRIAFSTYGTLTKAVEGSESFLKTLIDAGCFINDSGKEGTFAVINDALVLGEFEYQCVYGHTSHEGIECAEPIEAWQKWTSTTSLPTANGNYYIPEGSTLNLSAQTIVNNTNLLIDVKVDLRGSTVNYRGASSRMLLIKGATGSQYVVTSTTEAKGVMQHTETTVNSYADCMIYANIGTIRLINIKVDTTSIVNNTAANNSIAYVSATGFLHAENCVLIGGQAKNGYAIYQVPHATGYTRQLVLKDTTVEGGLYLKDSATRTYLEGTVKLLPGTYGTFGISGGAAAAEIKCQNLTADSELVAASLNYTFADEATATAANGTVIKAVDGKKITVSGKKLTVTEADAQYCIYGHTAADHEGEASACTEEIVTWTVWSSTTSLPTANGNYYVPANTTINMSSQCIINDTSRVVDIKLDLRGSTVNVNGEGTRALLLKGAEGSKYVVTSTTGKNALFKTTATTQNTNANGFIYANIGTVRLVNINVDTTSVTSGETYSTVAHVLNTGIFIAENCNLKGGYSKTGRVIYQNPTGGAADTDKPINLILKDTTVEGGVYVNGSAVKTQLVGVVKLLKGTGTYGIMGSATAAEFTCSGLTEGSVLEAANCNYRFADATAAAAANGVIIQAAAGSVLSVNGSLITATVQ